jgi:hypothetical protein
MTGPEQIMTDQALGMVSHAIAAFLVDFPKPLLEIQLLRVNARSWRDVIEFYPPTP